MIALKNENGSKKLFNCHICGISIVKMSNAHKYCKACAKKKHQIQKNMHIYEKRRKYVIRKHSLGTTNLFEHKANDLGVEHRRIQFEIHKLGFKRQFT